MTEGEKVGLVMAVFAVIILLVAMYFLYHRPNCEQHNESTDSKHHSFFCSGQLPDDL